jgi:hypothetical protein
MKQIFNNIWSLIHKEPWSSVVSPHISVIYTSLFEMVTKVPPLLSDKSGEMCTQLAADIQGANYDYDNILGCKNDTLALSSSWVVLIPATPAGKTPLKCNFGELHTPDS